MRYCIFVCPFLLLAGCAHQGALAPIAPAAPNALRQAQGEPPYAFRVLHNFQGPPNDGAKSVARLTEQGSTLYGTTDAGGRHNRGVIFKITPDGAYLVLHHFGDLPGEAAGPKAGLVVGGANLYGTTFAGGASGDGTIYSTPKGRTLDLIHSFTRSSGSGPRADLTYAVHLYGTTEFGGDHDVGTVFEIYRRGSRYRVLHSFAGSDGARPRAGLLRVGLNFYGTTYAGGAHGFGTVFELALDGGSYRVLHSFGSTSDDGRHPECQLVELNGLLYGTTVSGGADQDGTIFEVKPDGAERVVHDFAGLGGVYAPVAGLTVLNGWLYGTTSHSSRLTEGSVFAFNPATRNLHVMHRFHGSDGGSPNASLTVANGNLDGTTYRGGSSGHGVIFEVTP